MKKNKDSGINSIFRFVKLYQFPILWIAIAVTFISGFVSLLRQFENTSVNYFSIVFATMQLFILEGNSEPGEQVLLSIIRIVAPLLLGFAAWETFAVLFADQIRMLKLPLLKNHIVICGLGERGYHMVKSCEESSEKKRKVVVVEPDAENDYIPACKQMGVLVINGNANEMSTLHNARVIQADVVYIVTGDDGLNMSIGMQVQSLVSEYSMKRDQPVRCYVTISDLFYAEIASNHKRTLTNAQFSMIILRPNAIGARSLFNTYPLDGSGVTPTSEKAIHLIVAGFGCMGEDVAMQAARIGHFANGKKIKITVVDIIASEKLAIFLRMFPGLSQCAEWEALNYNIEKSEFLEWLEKLNRSNVLLHVAICINDSSHAVRAALQIDHLFPKGNVPVYVRMENFESSGAFLRFSLLTKENRNLHPFGLFSEVYIDAIVNNKGCDRIAKELYALTMNKSDTGRETEKEAVSWELLDHEVRQSNRHQADHLFTKARALGYGIGPVNDSLSGYRVIDFEIDEIELMAKMEHARWCAEMFIRGWNYGVQDDFSRRISSSMSDFNRLTEERKELHRRKVKVLPKVLERTGLWIYRSSVKM